VSFPSGKTTVGNKTVTAIEPSPLDRAQQQPLSNSLVAQKNFPVIELNVMYQHHPQSGFSLIELLIVVAIIGIVSAIAIPSLVGARAAAEEAAAIACLRTIHSSQATMKVTLGRYGRMSELNQTLTLGTMAGPTVKRQDYTFQTIPTAPTDAQLTSSYKVAATGLGPDRITPYIFLVDDSGIISQLSP
jgi:prepilin-type N-terminal cleavage/methylation domain-containing protein